MPANLQTSDNSRKRLQHQNISTLLKTETCPQKAGQSRPLLDQTRPGKPDKRRRPRPADGIGPECPTRNPVHSSSETEQTLFIPLEPPEMRTRNSSTAAWRARAARVHRSMGAHLLGGRARQASK